MADFECDTDKLREDGRKIMEYCDDITDNLNKFFTTINDLAIDGVWSGKNSTLFRNEVEAYQKKQYYTFSNGVKAIGNDMVNFADVLDNRIRKNEEEYDD